MTENIFRASDPEFDSITAKVEELDEAIVLLSDRLWVIERTLQRLGAHLMKYSRGVEQDIDNI